MTRSGCRIEVRTLAGPATTLEPGATRRDDTIERQDDDGTHDSHDEADRLARSIEAQHAPHPAADQGTDNAEDDRENKSSRIPTGHDELRDDADDETEQDPHQDVHHEILSTLCDLPTGP